MHESPSLVNDINEHNVHMGCSIVFTGGDPGPKLFGCLHQLGQRSERGSYL